MKKKLMALSLAVAVLAIAAVGSLAYFTDKDDKTNTFTVGNVDITLVEEFDPDNAKLLPGSQANNAVKKEVSIKVEDNSQDTYVWYEWLIPAALDSTDGSTGTNNVVHVNSYGYTWDKYRTNSNFWQQGQTEALPEDQTWDHTMTGTTEGFVGTETIDGIVYNKYVALYHGVVKAGETTTPGMSQVYLDSKVDTNAEGKYTINGDVIDYDFTKGVNIIVRAYGIQADGFDDVYAAYNAYQAQA